MVAPRLRAAGYEVAARDLQGGGSDPTPPHGVTFADYIVRIAGGPISPPAEETAEQVAGLVYLTAMLPKDGETLGTMVEFGEDSVLRGARPSEVAGTTAFEKSLAVEIFYNTTPPALPEAAIARLAKLAPSEPFMARISLSAARWGAIPKTYIQYMREQAIPLSVQRWLCARAPGVAVLALDTDHSPFLSAPGELAASVDAIAKALVGA